MNPTIIVRKHDQGASNIIVFTNSINDCVIVHKMHGFCSSLTVLAFKLCEHNSLQRFKLPYIPWESVVLTSTIGNMEQLEILS